MHGDLLVTFDDENVFFLLISKLVISLLGWMMEDTTRLTHEQSVKLFIQRDYSEGTAVKFRENFPRDLEGKVKRILLYSFVTNLLLSHFFRSTNENS